MLMFQITRFCFANHDTSNIHYNNFIQPYDQLLNRFDRYSSWNKVRRAAANCLRLKAKMLRATKTLNRQIELKDIMTEPNTPMTVQDLQEGEKAVIKEVQSIAFQKEIAVFDLGYH